MIFNTFNRCFCCIVMLWWFFLLQSKKFDIMSDHPIREVLERNVSTSNQRWAKRFKNRQVDYILAFP